MNEPENFSVRTLQKKRELSAAPAVAAAIPPADSGPLRPVTKLERPAVPAAKSLPFDPLRLVAAVARKWKWLPLAGAALALPIFLYGFFKFQTGYTVKVQLIRAEVTTTIRQSQLGDAFKPLQVNVGTLVSVMQSPNLLEKSPAWPIRQ